MTGMSYCQVSYDELSDIYSEAIKHHCDILKKSDSKLVEINNLYFIHLDIPKENLPIEIEEKKINYLDVYDKKNKKLLKHRTSVISIKPLILEKNKIIISIYNVSISLKNNEYNISTGDGTQTIFEYSCEKGWIRVN